MVLLRMKKNNHAMPNDCHATPNDWHVQYSLAGLNAKLFEESILDSIQIDASGNKNWAAKTKDINNALARLNMLGADQFNSLSTNNKAALKDIFRGILNDVGIQQSRIGEIVREEKAASFGYKLWGNTRIKEIKGTATTLKAVGEQVETLLNMLTISERLREQAHHLRELDSANEGIDNDEERTEVSNKIVDLFSEAVEAGVDLSNELSNDEIVYLTRGMGAAEVRLDKRGLIKGDEKKALYVDGKEEIVDDITRRDTTDRLARQTGDLLHGPQLQSLLTRLTHQEDHLNALIDHLKPFQPNSASAILEKTEGVLNALARIDKAEVFRLCNHKGEKGDKAESALIDGLDRIETSATTLRITILNTLDAPETSSITNEDRRPLTQAAKLLEHVQSNVSALQGESLLKINVAPDKR